MFPIQSTFGFASGRSQPYAFHEDMLCFYAQDHLGVYPSMLGGLYAPASNSEVSPWAWQWGKGTSTQKVCNLLQSPSTQHTELLLRWQDSLTHHPYTASIPQARVQPTDAVDQAPPTFCRAVGGPVSNTNTNRPEIVCPRPIHPLPKWVDTTEWKDDEDETTPEEDEERIDLTLGPVDADNNTDWEGEESSDEDTDWEGEELSDEDYDEGFDVPHRFLPSFIISPHPEDLPAPFFHPSNDSTPPSHTFASLSPEACDLPQPCFGSDPYPLVSDASSRSVVSEPGRPQSSRSDSFGSIVSPDPEDLPTPDFEIYDRIEIEGFQFPGPLNFHQDQFDQRGTQGRARWGLGEGLWKAVTNAGRKASGSGHRRGWLDWSWDG